MSRVSIVMTCFNNQHVLEKAIASIIRQDCVDWELFLVDEGSSDDSVRIARSFSDPRIMVIAKETSGPSDAWNVGIKQAVSEFVILASSNDEFEEGLVSQQLAAQKANDADVSFCLPTLIDEQGLVVEDKRHSSFFNVSFQGQEEAYFKLFSIGNFLLTSGVLIRRSLFSRFGFFKSSLFYLQDFDLWVRLAPHCKMVHISERLVRYRLMGENSTLLVRPDPIYIAAEYRLIYREFFDHAPRAFVRDAFEHVMEISDSPHPADREVKIALLLMMHRQAEIQTVGLERAMVAMSLPEQKASFRNHFGIEPRELLRLAKGVAGADPLQRELWSRYDAHRPAKKKKKKLMRRLLRTIRRFQEEK